MGRRKEGDRIACPGKEKGLGAFDYVAPRRGGMMGGSVLIEVQLRGFVFKVCKVLLIQIFCPNLGQS